MLRKRGRRRKQAPRHAVTRVRGFSLNMHVCYPHIHMDHNSTPRLERTYSVSGCTHIVQNHQRSDTDTCTIHSNQSCKSTLSGVVSTWRPRDPRRLVPAFRGGHKIGGAECGLAVRDERNSKRRRGSTSVVAAGLARPSILSALLRSPALAR